MSTLNEPCVANSFLSDHAQLLVSSFNSVTGRQLLELDLINSEASQILFDAPFAVVSHGVEADPVFNYGNKTALDLFEMSWSKFTLLPSRLSAEQTLQTEREQLLARVKEYGFIDDYRGVRISASGKRFWVERAVVWNVFDESSVYRGQAAVLYDWSFCV